MDHHTARIRKAARGWALLITCAEQRVRGTTRPGKLQALLTFFERRRKAALRALSAANRRTTSIR